MNNKKSVKRQPRVLAVRDLMKVTGGAAMPVFPPRGPGWNKCKCGNRPIKYGYPAHGKPR